jgi:hypothetical protein
MTPKPTPSHLQLPRRLRVLIGTWAVSGEMPAYDHPMRGTTSIKWLVKDALLEVRTRIPGTPTSRSVIGVDDVNDTFTMLYTDDRPVLRRYEMTLTTRRWTIIRHAPGFHQRFIGNIAPGGRRITGRWEKSTNGRRWDLDFRIVYTKRMAAKR